VAVQHCAHAHQHAGIARRQHRTAAERDCCCSCKNNRQRSTSEKG
jgi:hypothetical protein